MKRVITMYKTFNIHSLFVLAVLWVMPGATAQPVQKLITATADQDRRFAEALAVGQHGKWVALKSLGRMDYSPDAAPRPKDAVFDLASVTKVVGCTPAAAILYDRKQLEVKGER